MEAARDELLAGAALAVDQDGLRLAAGELADHVAELAGRLGLADELVDAILLLLELVEPLDLPAGPHLLERAHHGQLELVQVLERLLEVVRRACLHRLDGALHLAVARDDDHDDLGVTALEHLEHVHPVAVRQPEVEQDDVRGDVVRHLEAFLARRGAMHLDDPVLREHAPAERPNVPLVVDDQDVVHRFLK